MRTARMLAQTALSTTVSTVYTSPASTVTQVTQIWLANTSAEIRAVSLRAHGTAAENTLADRLEVPANGVAILDCKIVLAAGEVFAASQDAGTDVVFTAYGIQEVS